MSRSEMKLQSVSVTKVLLLVTATPGLTTAQIAERLGYSMSYVRQSQDVARDCGLMGCVPIDGLHGSRGRGWYAGEALQAAREAWAEIAERRLLERRKKSLARMRNHEPATGGAKPVHRRIPAKSKRPLPFVVNAPNSVFALGADETPLAGADYRQVHRQCLQVPRAVRYPRHPIPAGQADHGSQHIAGHLRNPAVLCAKLVKAHRPGKCGQAG